MKLIFPDSLLWVSQSTVESLLKYYDYPHPIKSAKIILGYDKEHVTRTAKMCAAVAKSLNYSEKIIIYGLLSIWAFICLFPITISINCNSISLFFKFSIYYTNII